MKWIQTISFPVVVHVIPDSGQYLVLERNVWRLPEVVDSTLFPDIVDPLPPII